MWKAVSVVTVFMTAMFVDGYLNRRHVCHKREKYNVTVEHPHKINITQREYVWCLSVPPRCSKYYTKSTDDVKVVYEERVKIVEVCCSGYREVGEARSCVPVCSQCVRGKCVQPDVCACHAGYTGAACDQACPSGSWGLKCAGKCECPDGVKCNPTTGSCVCPAHWTEAQCKQTNRNHDEQTIETTTITEHIKKSSDDNLQHTIFATSTYSEESTDIALLNRTDSTELFYVITVNQSSSQETNELPNRYIVKKIEHPQKGDLITKIFIVFGVTMIIILAAIIISIAHRKQIICIKRVNMDDTKIINQHEKTNSNKAFSDPLPDVPVYQNPKNNGTDAVLFISSDEKITPFYFRNDESLKYYEVPILRSFKEITPTPEPTSDPIYDEIPAERRPVTNTSN